MSHLWPSCPSAISTLHQACTPFKKTESVRGTWVAPLVEHLTLGFGSSHDLAVCGVKSSVGLCTDSTESVWDSLSPSFSDSLSLFLSSLCLSKQQQQKLSQRIAERCSTVLPFQSLCAQRPKMGSHWGSSRLSLGLPRSWVIVGLFNFSP